MSKKCVCDFCGTCFRHKSELQHHVNGVHLKLKPFQCESCELSFTLNGDLKKHVKEVHQKLKAHKCEYCSASFSRRYNLKVAIFLNLNFYICLLHVLKEQPLSTRPKLDNICSRFKHLDFNICSGSIRRSNGCR